MIMEKNMTEQNLAFPSKEIFEEKLYDIFKKNSLEKYLDEDKADKFYRLAVALVETNKSLNLTAVTDADGIALKHFADSLIATEEFPEGATVIDVGCGGGFPTFPLAIVRPDLKITALDSTEKKINFVAKTAIDLGLDNINAISDRAESLGKGTLRESFDVATARAVAALPVLTELCLPFVKVGGDFVAMKALRADEEIDATLSENLFEKLGGEKKPRVTPVTLVGGDEPLTRVVIKVKKIAKTPPSYPRNYSQIAKSAKKRTK